MHLLDLSRSSLVLSGRVQHAQSFKLDTGLIDAKSREMLKFLDTEGLKRRAWAWLFLLSVLWHGAASVACVVAAVDVWPGLVSATGLHFQRALKEPRPKEEPVLYYRIV